MDRPRKYVKRLRRLYDRRKIGVDAFACPHLKSCRKAAKAKDRKLCLGAEAHVGRNYGDPIRLVVVSLDTGGSAGTSRGKDLRKRRSTVQGVTFSGTNQHMKGTIQILRHLYGEEAEAEILPRFAMINSAKCSGKDDKSDSVPDTLYQNCREHGLAELDKLEPQLVVTQGAKAREMMELDQICEKEIRKHVPRLTWGGADVGSWICAQAAEYLRYWRNGEQCVLVLQAPHPSARQGQWQRFERTMLPTIAEVIRKWLPVPPLH